MAKAAILIDGGYFLKRLPIVRPDIDSADPEAVAGSVRQLVRRHLDQLNEVHRLPNPFQLLYRTFFYDARPYGGKAHKPVSNSAIDYARTDQARFRFRLFDALRSSRNLAVRLGEVRKDNRRSWSLNPEPQKELLNGRLLVENLTDDDFAPALRQKRCRHANRAGYCITHAQGPREYHHSRFWRCGFCPGGEVGPQGERAVRARSSLAAYSCRLE